MQPIHFTSFYSGDLDPLRSLKPAPPEEITLAHGDHLEGAFDGIPETLDLQQENLSFDHWGNFVDLGNEPEFNLEMNLPSQQMEEPVFPPISHLLSTSSNLKNEEESLQSHPPEEPEIELLSLAPPQQRPHRKPTVLIDSQIILSDATMRSHFEDTSDILREPIFRTKESLLLDSLPSSHNLFDDVPNSLLSLYSLPEKLPAESSLPIDDLQFRGQEVEGRDAAEVDARIFVAGELGVPLEDLFGEMDENSIQPMRDIDSARDYSASQIFTHDGSEIQATPQKPIHFGFDEPFLPFDVPYSPIAEISPSRNVVESFDSATL
eukprot:CAMPEP_0201494570 /NCGR_PEP_ID=MMETSP0151_2-20130828/48382_1 /ASSEMBLY_ACC=CAM_ASM_000257 /TAXON_ID=200890 /ORGANISM="Paramoeba atlantica, Strain 621/1 / CCAP 1560/9" /LENGTH=320 /DNA_ID=CAMNT_0047882915 /DNA_START=51 /DNA_END=1010 /DNA_ORIENTATION=+